MSFTFYPIEAFEVNDNYIWALINNDNAEVIIIDPGSAEIVAKFVTERQLTLVAIWLTHRHWDHNGGVADLKRMYPDTTVVAHPQHGVQGDVAISGGDSVAAWSFTAEVWDIAGHTANHLAYVIKMSGRHHVLCGDTIFSGGCGRVLGGSIEQLYDSFIRINTLPADTLLYPAHEYTVNNLKFGLSIEPNNKAMQQALHEAEQAVAQGQATLPVTLAHERDINIFMRVKESTVIAGVTAKMALIDTQPLTVFAALRELKNNF